MTLTVDHEIAAMRRRWPTFRTTTVGNILVKFCGTLVPFRQIYQVRVLYSPQIFLGRFHLFNYHPRVELISPQLVLCHPHTGAPVPHVYPNDDHPASPLLCLYDPATDEWCPGDTPIADTIVPWTAHWLACYEGWLATGKWSGGGRHPTSHPSRTPANDGRHPAADAAPDDSARLIGEVARAAGTHASRAILAHETKLPRHFLDTAEGQFMYQELVRAGLAGPDYTVTAVGVSQMPGRNAA